MTDESFYAVVGGIGFTLHGLWWVVVQGRPEWSDDRARRLLSYVVGLHLLIPATTSLLSIIAPDEPLVWRLTFVAAGIVGIAGVLLVQRAIREDMDAPRLARTVEWVVLPIYALITILAVNPALPSALGLGLTALQVEAIVVTALLFFGVEAAWIMMVEPRTASGVARASSEPAPITPAVPAGRPAGGPPGAPIAPEPDGELPA